MATSPKTAVSSGAQSPDNSTRARIEKCALELFATKGFSASSVREIVEAAGVTKPTLYYYFGNKEGLYQTVIQGSVQRFFSELAGVIGPPRPLRARLRAMANTYYDWLRNEPLLATAIYRDTFGFTSAEKRLDCEALAGNEIQAVERMLQEAADNGEIAPSAVSEFNVIQFLALIHIYVTRQAAGLRDDLEPSLADKVVDFYLRGIG
jgi:AcrR family transcriptional regulator